MSEESIINKLLEVDGKKIKDAVRYQLPIEVTSYTLPRNMEVYIREVLHKFLDECHQEQMFECLNFCNGELLTNAKKANTKRIYFKERGLDLNNPDDYELGMLTFKEDTLTNIDHYLELQKKEGLYVKITLQLKGEQIKVEIRNNSTLIPKEKERIQGKIDSVQEYTSMEEVFMKVLDQSEGAGLGIIIIILMLQKIGLSKENYQVIATETETITKIVLPCNEKVFAATEILSYEYVKLQDYIPVRKDYYEKFIEVLSAEKIDREQLFELLKQDVTLFIIVLKKSNSLGNKEIEIGKVLDLLSDEQLKEILNNEAEEVCIVEDESKYDAWEHSKNVAYYSYNIVKNFPDIQDVINPEEAYALGLLDNIGTIMLASPSDEQVEYVKDLCAQYENPQKIEDVFYSGTTSVNINMLYAKRIGIPDEYAAILASWNNLKISVERVRAASKILYLAEFLQLYDDGIAEFYQLDEDTLNCYGITTEQQFKEILSKLKE